MTDKMVEKLQKLPNFIQTIMYSGLILFNGHPATISQNKKDELVKDIDILIAELNTIKENIAVLEIKQN